MKSLILKNILTFSTKLDDKVHPCTSKDQLMGTIHYQSQDLPGISVCAGECGWKQPGT